MALRRVSTLQRQVVYQAGSVALPALLGARIGGPGDTALEEERQATEIFVSTQPQPGELT